MRALVYHGPGQKAWEEVPDPEITDEGDVIVRVDATTICGTDLHILAGDVPEVQPGQDPRPRGGGDRRRGRRQRAPALAGRPGSRLLYQRVRNLPVLPRGPLRAVPGRRRLGPRPPHRRHPGRVRPRPVRRHLHLPDPRRRAGRGDAHAGRHPADRLRGRRAGRRRPAGRRGGRRGRRPGRPVRDRLRAAVQPQPHRRRRPVRRPPRGRPALRRRRHHQRLHAKTRWP